MKRTEGISWQFPRKREESIQNMLDAMFALDCEFRKNKSAKGISKEYLEYIKFLIESALKYKK